MGRLSSFVVAVTLATGCASDRPPPGRAPAAVTAAPGRSWLLAQMEIVPAAACATPTQVAIQRAAIDVDGNPDVGWSETDACRAPAGLVPRWAIVVAGFPEIHTIGDGLGGGAAGLRGTPSLFLGHDNTLRLLVDDLNPRTGATGTALIDLAQAPTGPGTAIEAVGDPASACGSAAYQAIGEATPEWVTLTGCGELRLDGAMLLDVPVAGFAFDRTDDGADLVLYNAGGNVHLNGGATIAAIRPSSPDLAIAHAGSTLYSAIIGYESQGDSDPGLLGVATSFDGGSTWTAPLDLDTSREAAGVRLAVDRRGAPAVLFWVRGDLHLAQLVDKDWQDEIVASLPFSDAVAGQRQSAFAFDADNQPVIVFYNWCASAITLARPEAPGNVAPVDLVVATTVAPPVVRVGETFAATIRISNQGSGQAGDVAFTQTLAPGTTLLSAEPPPDVEADGLLTFHLGRLESCCADTIVLELSATAIGVASGTGTASSEIVDANPADNSAPLTIDVRGVAITNPGDQTSAEGSAVSLPIAASDPAGSPLAFSATGLPPGLAIDPTTGVIAGTLPFTAAGSYAVVVSVADGLGDTASARFGWTVTDTDRPPIIQRIPDQQSYAGDAVSIPVVASDPDGDALSFRSSLLPPGIAIDPRTGTISGTLPFGPREGRTITVTVDDGRGGVAQTTFHWNILANQPPPPPRPIPDQTNHEGDTIVPLAITTGLTQQQIVTLSATGLPAGLTLQGEQIVGTIAYTTAGVHLVTITATNNHGASSSTQFTWTVIDVPALFVTGVTVGEGDGQAYFSVFMSDPVQHDVIVDAQTADGTAIAGSDYTRVSRRLVIPAGETLVTFAVPILEDTLSEADETFTVSLSSASGAPIGRAQATGTIVDDDPLPAITVGNVSLPEGNSGTPNFHFPVTLSAPSGQVVTVAWATEDGSATAPADYRSRSGTVKLAVGETEATISVPVVGDLVPEPDETFAIVLSNPVGATLATPRATGKILNDDVLAVSIGDVRAPAPTTFGGTDFLFPIALSAPCPDGTVVSVTYATADGTALAGLDYVAVRPTVVQFQPGEQQKTVPVHVNTELFVHETRQFTVNLTNASGAAMGDAQGVGTILGVDPLPSLAIGDVAQSEGTSGTTAFDFAVTVSAASFHDITVDFATSDGTATAGSDYVPATGTLTIPAGQTQATIRVDVVGDTVPEPDETFFVDLTSPTQATLARARGQGTIFADDADVVTVHDAVGHEPATGQASLSFPVTLAYPLATSVHVLYTTTDGTAHSGADYVGGRGVVDIAAGAVATTIDIPILADTLREGPETFQVTLVSAGGGVRIGGSATGTILDPGAPWLGEILPTSGPVGAPVKLVGNTLDHVTTVTFAAPFGQTPARVVAAFAIVSPTEIATFVPEGAGPGRIVVSNAAGSFSSPGPFVVTPSIDSFTPTSGGRGSTVVIAGKSFGQVSDVRFNGARAHFTMASDGSIHAIVPQIATTGPIQVTNGAGSCDTSALTPPDFTVR